MTKASYIVVHTGARRGYAVPKILAGAGMLDRFYTDACGSSGIGRASALLRHLPIVGDRFQRLHGRELPPSIVSKTRTFDIPTLQYAIESWRAKGGTEAGFWSGVRHNDRLGCAMVQAGFGQATHVYSMLGEGGPYLKEAKRRGLTVVSEVYIVLAMESILVKERQAFSKWEPDAPDYSALRRKHSMENVLVDYSDFFICPSDAVRDDLTANWGVEPSKTAVVPYGVNADWLQVEPRPANGRVLFVGTAELRKGIHYFAMAAARLKACGYPFEFAVAGNVSSRIATLAECHGLNFLGRVPRNEMHCQYQWADVFVLPSLAEGSAESVYEAMACGVPIVTTAAAGSVVRHGVEGFIVPERDPDALAEAIRQIVEDRNLRERMSIAARERARDYTWERYGQRLIEALDSIPSKARPTALGSRPKAVTQFAPKLRVLVAQNGARRNYAVPAVLAQAGMLDAFYTDVSGNVGPGRWISAARYLPWVGRPFDRLYQRQIPSMVCERATAFSYSTMADTVLQDFFGAARNYRYTGNRMLRHGLGNANLLYSFLGWGRPLLEEARSRGIPIVTDFYVRPSIAQICQEEFQAFPGWEAESENSNYVNRVGGEDDPCLVSDYLIVADSAVADEVASIHRFPRERIAVVPLGVKESLFDVRNEPVAGRVLFAGTCFLWKGIHYFAMASETLAARGSQYEFRVAGNVTPLVRNQPSCRHLNFLGRIPRNQIQHEYETADVLVLPTLADSFGLVQLEAMAVGIPVVTTRTAGSVVRHGIDGLIVPERDSNALADATARIVEDRALRERMSIAARERAREYTWERYGVRLIDALQRFAEGVNR